jgi:nitrogen fixation/metabolism regulation signal transduction histidine kinase
MVFDRHQTGTALRTAGLLLSAVVTGWVIEHTQWYVAIGLCVGAVAAQAALLMRFTMRSSHEIARFLDAVAVDDTSQSFSGLLHDQAHSELAAAMSRVLAKLRAGRSEREAQAQYLQSLLNHVPVALVSLEDSGKAQLLNMAARRLFETPLTHSSQLARHGTGFAVGIESLRAGGSTLVRMERVTASLQLKAAATEIATSGTRQRLISLQNIETEMSAQEMAAWQTVIRVMAHEVMNSLTPVSSLAATAHKLVEDVLKQLPADDPHAVTLRDAHEALETVARRSEGLLHFVQNHRRLTKRLSTNIELTPIRRVFARVQRLLASDLAARDIQMTATVEPETLEIAVDVDLLDQALINLVRNAIEALREAPAGLIALAARRDPEGHITLSVADNGHGIAPDQHEKVFVPFFTTKRQGSGIGLTIVRQIATAHGASVVLSRTPGGGATFCLRF